MKNNSKKKSIMMKGKESGKEGSPIVTNEVMKERVDKIWYILKANSKVELTNRKI